MSNEILTFGDIEVEKKKLLSQKSFFFKRYRY